VDPYKNISKEHERFLKHHNDIKREVNFLSRILKKGSVWMLDVRVKQALALLVTADGTCD